MTADLPAVRSRTVPDREAIRDADRDARWTYAELDRWVDRLAADLVRHAPGRIGIALGARPAMAAVSFATLRAGSSAVLLDPRLPEDRLAALADRAGLEAVVCGRSSEAAARACAAGPVLSVDEPTSSRIERLGTGDRDPPTEATPPLDGEAVVAFTSGSAGRPSGVRLTWGNLLSSAVASARRLGVDPDDRWLVCLPPHHMGGFTPIVRTALTGRTLVTQRSFDPRATASVLAGEAITVVSLVPTMLRRLLEDRWTPPASLRVVLLGGAPARPALLERCLERDVPVHPTYGMTETASQVATATPAVVAGDPETVGRPLAGTEVRIVDGDRPVPAGTTGAIQIAGPTVMAGYLEAALTDGAFDGRWLRTGDVGHRGEDGRLYVTGRTDDRIVTGGETVDRSTVEAAIEALEGVAAAAVIGTPDPDWGERVEALLVPEAGPIDPVDVREALGDRLAGHECPKTIAVAGAIPRTDSGTVDRPAVRARIAEHGVAVDNRH